jgi:hypothetical protein
MLLSWLYGVVDQSYYDISKTDSFYSLFTNQYLYQREWRKVYEK